MVLAVGSKEALDVTTWDSNVVELEERPDTKKISISVKDGSFVIEQGGVSASTDYPISIDPKESGLSVATSSGSSYLSVLPLEAVETALRSKFITTASSDRVKIEEDDPGKLAYGISGEREIKLLSVIDLKVPVTTYVSTTTGEILNIDQPKWLSIFGFLFA